MRSRRARTGFRDPARRLGRPGRLGRLGIAVLAVLAAAAIPALPAGASAKTARTGAAETTTRAGHGLVTQGQALARARLTGRPVQVTAATTSSSILTANPGGTLTLTEQNLPVRKDINGTWKPLDPALHRGPDGAITTAVTTAPLTLSGGGTAPLITTTIAGHTLTLTLPGRLPAPVLSGATATYPDVPAPGTSLQVTADPQGGFQDILIVTSAAAARSPALRAFSLRPAVTGGLLLHADAHGNLIAATPAGRAYFEIPAALMWDSRTPAKTIPTGPDPAYGRRVDLRDGQPVTSAAASPGENARTANVPARYHAGTLTYTPAPSILTGKNTIYPVYIDPAAGGVLQYWAQADSAFPTQTYPKPNPMQVGYNGWESPYFTARSFVRESVPTTLDGTATDIESSTLYLTDEYAPACDSGQGNFGVQVWYTGAIGSGTDWNSQPAWNTEEASKSFAHGYSSSCPAASEGFTVTGAMTSAAHGSAASVTFGIRADSESDPYGWKQFSDSVTLSTTYDKAPNAPGDLRTSPTTDCAASTPTTVGDGDVILYSTITDPLGSSAGSLTATVNVTDDATGKAAAGSPFTFTGLGNGSDTTVLLKEATLKALAGTAITEFSWHATVTDGTLTSPASKTCNFDYDPSSPGAPTVTANATSYTIGTSASFSITRNATGVTPDSYAYQVNGAAPHTVTTTTGNATISVTPTSGAEALTVTAISAGGNIGQSAIVFFTAKSPANAADGDMTGDGVPDLVTPGGGSSGLPPGLWLARGQAAPGGGAGDGQLVSATSDIGAEGDGLTGNYAASDFTGAQVITGLFNDNGLQGTLAYYPSGTYAGQGAVLNGTGDGTILDDKDATNATSVESTTFVNNDPNGDIPLQIVNGYNADPNDSPAYADLITVSGDATSGYYLEYYQNGGSIGNWIVSDVLTTPTPDGTMDWNNWQITTMQEPSGAVDMFLYTASTQALYLWQGLTVNDGLDTAGYTQYQLSTSFSPGTLAELRAADITGTGPALWTVTTTGNATPWIVSGLTGTPAITADTVQSLLSPTHVWRLGDGTTGAVASAADTGTGPALPLTGSAAGANWVSGDLFSPAAAFNGTSGYLTGTSGLGGFANTSDYTISAWVKPASVGGVVFAESDESTDESCMDLYLDTYTDSSGDTFPRWDFRTTSANSASPTLTVASTGSTNSVHVGAWTHIAVTYNASAGYMELYVNGIPATSASPSTVWSSGCTSFEVAHYFDQGQIHAYFHGEIADVQVWRGATLTPTEIADLSGTPGYDLFPSDGTQYVSASSATAYQWKTACADLGFYQGTLNVKETCSGSTTFTKGTSGNPNAVLTLQKDGNLVIYANAADAKAGNTGALWASNTGGNPGDAMFLQPDGNLVIYGTYGNVLWKSNTDN